MVALAVSASDAPPPMAPKRTPAAPTKGGECDSRCSLGLRRASPNGPKVPRLPCRSVRGRATTTTTTTTPWRPARGSGRPGGPAQRYMKTKTQLQVGWEKNMWFLLVVFPDAPTSFSKSCSHLWHLFAKGSRRGQASLGHDTGPSSSAVCLFGAPLQKQPKERASRSRRWQGGLFSCTVSLCGACLQKKT